MKRGVRQKVEVTNGHFAGEDALRDKISMEEIKPFFLSLFILLFSFFSYPYFQKQVVCFSLCQKGIVPLNRERFSYDVRFRVDVSSPAASQLWLWLTMTPSQPPVSGNHCPEDGGNSTLVMALLPF